MVGAITVGERILLHLSRFSRHQEDYDVPFDVSQDGIASAVRISRAHAAIELKKLRESGDVSERLAHIRRGKTRRKVYFLTPGGEERTANVKEYAKREGIDILPLLDLRRCDPGELWVGLDEQHRSVLGAACVFRLPFPRALLPETVRPVLPVDEEGMVDMPQDLREGIPPLMDPGELRRCHSVAADFWLDQGDYRERLYHLIMAKRGREAEMLVSTRGEELLDEVDDDLLATLSMIAPSDRYRWKVLWVQAEAARLCGDGETCVSLADALIASDDPATRRKGALVKGALLLETGEAGEALDLLISVREGEDVELECSVAEALYRLSRFEEAEEMLETLMERNRGRSSLDHADLIFYHLAMLNRERGETREAIRYLSKGMGMSRDVDKGVWYMALAEAYDALGMKEKAAEYTARLRGSGSA